MNHFSPAHYVPILRWKEAERTALARLSPSDSKKLTPLVEIVPESLGTTGKKTPSIEETANRISCQLFRCWDERPFFTDFRHLPQDILIQGSRHFLTLLDDCASTRQLSLIPTTGLSRGDPYQSAVLKFLGRHNQGACLRLSRKDISCPTLAQDLDRILSFLKTTPEEIDLIVDLEVIDNDAPTLNTLCRQIPHIRKWRNFIVASGAFPVDAYSRASRPRFRSKSAALTEQIGHPSS
ncbi:MAG: hypothetical protein NTU41_14505 [Chloroflexi bacterium]|nr:hypothetical protein [Chloroflexota bacterium]